MDNTILHQFHTFFVPLSYSFDTRGYCLNSITFVTYIHTCYAPNKTWNSWLVKCVLFPSHSSFKETNKKYPGMNPFPPLDSAKPYHYQQQSLHDSLRFRYDMMCSSLDLHIFYSYGYSHLVQADETPNTTKPLPQLFQSLAACSHYFSLSTNYFFPMQFVHL